MNKTLTREQFVALAYREPNLTGNWIYRLEMTEYGPGPHVYPRFKVGPTRNQDFPSFEAAEAYMREQSELIPMYRSRITQIPEGCTIAERGAQWLYDATGSLVDCTVTPKSGSEEETRFYGRPFDQQRFGMGDFVELLQGDEVVLCSVIFPVIFPEDCWIKYQHEGVDYYLSYKSDCYGIIFPGENNIQFALVTALMPTRFPVSKSVKKEMDKQFCSVVNHNTDQIRIFPPLEDDSDDEDDLSDEEVTMTDEEFEELMSQPIKKLLSKD